MLTSSQQRDRSNHYVHPLHWKKRFRQNVKLFLCVAFADQYVENQTREHGLAF